MCRAAIAVLLWAIAVGPAHAAAPQLSGEVTRGETFSAPLCDDLLFSLIPSSHGWTVWIGDPARPTENYAAMRTPPFRGLNALQIDGWHFRNRDNSGPNDAGPLNVNAPQHDRAFRFVTTRTDFEAARKALDVLLWPGNWGVDQIADATATLEKIPDAPGQLTIDGLELGNLVEGDQAWIERMNFTLSIWNRCP